MDSYCSRITKTKSLISFVMSSTGILMQRKPGYLPQLSFCAFFLIHLYFFVCLRGGN